MTEEEFRLLNEIRDRLTNYPEFAIEIYKSMSAGLKQSNVELANRAADMETVVSVVLHERLFKSQRTYIASLLTKWEGKTSLVFTTLIKKLEE
jgi:CRP-like cAMP-binding protein